MDLSVIHVIFILLVIGTPPPNLFSSHAQTFLNHTFKENKNQTKQHPSVCLACFTRQEPPSHPRILGCLRALLLLLAFLDRLWRYREAVRRQAPGWIISCFSMPDGHVAVTWRGNGKWHRYHSNTGATFGVRAGFQRICHTLVVVLLARQEYSAH